MFGIIYCCDPLLCCRVFRQYSIRIMDLSSLTLDLQHCLPFAAWPCNDLWNLFPARPDVNHKKGDKLPSADSLLRARDQILEWWQTAYIEQDMIGERFVDEAIAALPGALACSASPSAEDIFDGLMLQRAKRTGYRS